MGLLFLNSIMMISFFLVGNIETKLMVLHKLSEMDILKKNPNKTIVDFVVKLSSAHGKIVFRKTVTQLQLKALERRFIFQILSQD